MKLIALLLGLLLEHLLASRLHVRTHSWFAGWFATGARWMRAAPAGMSSLVGVLVMLLPALPVAFVAWVFRDLLAGLPYIVFATLVLFFSLGPRNLLAEVSDWLDAKAHGDEARARAIEQDICERDGECVGATTTRQYEKAILVQANHRIFGVIFWFMVLGPAGGWAYRCADLFRRHVTVTGSGGRHTRQAEFLFGIAAWAPARLLALSYAVAGSFDDAVEDWQDCYQHSSARFFSLSNHVLAAAGIGAIRRRCPEAGGQDAIEATRNMVRRALFIWLTVIAAMTLVGWAA